MLLGEKVANSKGVKYMKNKEKFLRNLIGIVIIIIIIIIILCIILAKQNLSGSNNEPYTKENDDMYINELVSNWEKVKYRDQYYTVETLSERFLTYANDAVNDDTGIKEESQKALYNIMDSKYIEEFGIKSEGELVKKYENLIVPHEEIDIQNMYMIDTSSNSRLFYVDAYLSLAQKDFNFFVKLDALNNTFSIFPQEYLDKHKYSEKSDKVDAGAERIEENEYNKYKMESVSDERMSVVYFNQVKSALVSNAEKAYNMLDEEYRKARFGSKEKFEKYLQDNKTELAKIQLQQYLYKYHDDYNEYVCKDQNGRLYIIQETAINEYKVQLDDYTIPDEEVTKKYLSATTQVKVVNNIDKWFKMLNNRDYEAAFKVLDETFRTQQFGNDVNRFEEYMRANYPGCYEFEQEEYTEETGISIQKLVIQDAGGSRDSYTFEATIYMQINEGTDFVMSFNRIE